MSCSMKAHVNRFRSLTNMMYQSNFLTSLASSYSQRSTYYSDTFSFDRGYTPVLWATLQNQFSSQVGSNGSGLRYRI